MGFSHFANADTKDEDHFISPEVVNTMIKNKKAILIDVRDDEEVQEGMAAPAVWLPLDKMEKDNPAWVKLLKYTPKNKKVVFYCAGGFRAAEAVKKMQKNGYQAFNMGGYSSWVKAGLPTKKP